MTIYNYKDGLSLPFSSSVVALGFFDGVHRGHRALLSAAKEKATELGLPFVVFSFVSESPGLKAPERLYSTDIKSELLFSLGAEYIVYANFPDMSEMSAEEFVSSFLLTTLGAKLAVCGRDFGFGKGRAGDAELLRKLMKDSAGEALIIEDELTDGEKISSTLIKDLIKDGKIKKATELLGEPFFIIGDVIKGDGRGKTLGIPTVNVSLQNDKSFLRSGVYHTKIEINGKRYTGITNVGVCPTFSERDRHTETFILGFCDTVYGESVKISFLDYLREEKKFDNKDALLEQIEKDLMVIKEAARGW